ncbi:unnamed protein product [Tetraodon nigroviridis]|uniref:(spotted green pufferfish) hypothetical protein n=1 Tax=Tetraodon nigroviridis TaxID=99883 RepID=Q4SW22_TETNG|nr:unnamed protein product [Tetraodon nigroviridis]
MNLFCFSLEGSTDSLIRGGAELTALRLVPRRSCSGALLLDDGTRAPGGPGGPGGPRDGVRRLFPCRSLGRRRARATGRREAIFPNQPRLTKLSGPGRSKPEQKVKSGQEGVGPGGGERERLRQTRALMGGNPGLRAKQTTAHRRATSQEAFPMSRGPRCIQNDAPRDYHVDSKKQQQNGTCIT